MWRKDGSIWVYETLNIITIEPAAGPDGQTIWQACCGGRPVPQIQSGDNLGVVMMDTVKYYDARIDMTTVKELWKL